MSRMKIKDIAVQKNERVDNPSHSPYSIFVGLEHYDSGEATIRRYGSTEMLESTMKVFHAGDILGGDGQHRVAAQDGGVGVPAAMDGSLAATHVGVVHHIVM